MAKEVSSLGKWSLSSYKCGQGLDQLLSPSTDTFWQSDGPQPHFINVQFPKKITLQVLIVIDSIETLHFLGFWIR